MTTKIWAQVEVEEAPPGWTSPRLVGGVDIEAARVAVREALALRLGNGPEELFNSDNKMYTAPRSMAEVIKEDYGQTAEAFTTWARERLLAHVDADATPERLARFADARGVPPDASFLLEDYRTYRRNMVDKQIERVLAATSCKGDDQGVSTVASWLSEVCKMPIRPADLAARTQGDDDAPFFSEAYLYTLLGKDHARSVITAMERLASALGVQA